MVITVFSQVGKSLGGEILAIDKQTGQSIYSIPIASYAWSSPVDIYDQAGNMYFILAEANGNLSLYEGLTGARIDTVTVGSVLESSPIAVDNYIMIGSRGARIDSYVIE